MSDELDLDALLSVADAATPGPWEYGNRWHVAGVIPGKFGKGRCVYCERYGEPTWTGELDINGQMMPAHVHTQDEPWHEHGMYALRDDGPVMVINDTDEYGYLEPEDAAFIATFDPPTVRQLIRAADPGLWEQMTEALRQRDALTAGIRELADEWETDLKRFETALEIGAVPPVAFETRITNTMGHLSRLRSLLADHSGEGNH